MVLRTKLCNIVALVDMTVQLCNQCHRFLAKRHSQENEPAASLKWKVIYFLGFCSKLMVTFQGKQQGIPGP